MGAQAVIDDDVGLVSADAVEVEVHDAEPGGLCHVVPAKEGAVLKALPLALVHAWIVADDVVVGGQEETAGAAGGVADGGVRLRTHDVHNGLYQGARGEVLARAGLDVLGVAFKQRLVGVAFDVGAEGEPCLAVDKVLHQAGQHGGFLDLVPGSVEDDPKRAGLPSQGFQRAAVVGLELIAVTIEQAGPVEAVGDGGRLVAGHVRMGRLGALVHHLEEQEECKLLQVVAVGETGVAEHVAVVPELLADGG